MCFYSACKVDCQWSGTTTATSSGVKDPMKTPRSIASSSFGSVPSEALNLDARLGMLQDKGTEAKFEDIKRSLEDAKAAREEFATKVEHVQEAVQVELEREIAEDRKWRAQKEREMIQAPRAGEYHPDDRPPAQKAFGPGEHPPDYAPSGREAPRPGEHPPDYAPAEKEAEEKDPAKPTEKPIVLKLVAVNGLALQHAAEDLWEDPEVVRTKDGLALEFAAEELQRDPRVEQNAFAKKHAAKELHADRDLKKDDTEEPRAVKQSRNASNHAAAEELRNDRDFILQVVKQDPDVLQLVSEELQCDKGVVIKALEGSIHALQHAAEKLQDAPIAPKEAAKKK
ncbi:unnamed protein product [Durusdinium trenchii]|uniref:DUF4116 domain-containing protein n=2 Tax=Durusdinium trenchii TaxID=1381693 RepID=A0ABP0QQR0_9DINO